MEAYSIFSTMPRIVLLAAGFSKRLGYPKLLARVRGTSLIRRTVQTLAPLVRSPLILVVPPRAARLRAELRGCRVHLVSNAARIDGLSTSVRRGLWAARCASAALLLPADLVRLERREMARLINRWRGARRRVVARGVDGRPGAPLILPRRLFARALRIEGDIGLRGLVRRLPTEDLTLMAVPSAAFDVDTPRDLDRARRDLKGQHGLGSSGGPRRSSGQ